LSEKRAYIKGWIKRGMEEGALILDEYLIKEKPSTYLLELKGLGLSSCIKRQLYWSEADRF
jgi:hypothetical protein